MLILYTFIAIFGLLSVDQAIKFLVEQTIKNTGEIHFISDIILFKYRENTGAAFSIFEGNTWMLSLVTAVAIGVGLYFIMRNKIRDPFAYWSIVTIISGGLGNLVDRIFRGYVVDYIYFKPINFPIFNFADMLIVCGEIFLAIYLIFFYDKYHRVNKNGNK